MIRLPEMERLLSGMSRVEKSQMLQRKRSEQMLIPPTHGNLLQELLINTLYILDTAILFSLGYFLPRSLSSQERLCSGCGSSAGAFIFDAAGAVWLGVTL